MAGKTTVIVTHRSLMPCIPGDDLKKYLLSQGYDQLLYITHPLLLLEESQQLRSEYQYHQKLKMTKGQALHWKLPESFSYLKDFLYTFVWVLKTGQKFDLYFGLNNMNALAGLILKKLGRVKKVVYYTIDLYPQRFPSKIINLIYHKVDRLCAKYCDETWNVSPYLMEYRGTMDKQFTVPIGIWFDEIKRVKKNNKNKIVYVGHLKDFYGVDLAVKALPLILKKNPKVILEIIGGGEQLDELQKLAEKLKLISNIKFHGWKEKKAAEEIMKDGAIGIAPFNTLLLNQKRYKSVADLIKNGDPAKIKDYLALGLPVVMTNASITATNIEKAGAAIIIEYTPESLANAVNKLLLDKKLHQEYRKNALKYIKQFDWNIIFEKNLSRHIHETERVKTK